MLQRHISAGLMMALACSASFIATAKADTVIIQEERTVQHPAVIGVELQLGPMENFRHRLAAISDQIKLGLDRGWLSGDQASVLSSKNAGIVAQLDAIRTRGVMTHDENVSLETQINILNQEVTNTMGGPRQPIMPVQQ